MRIKKVNSSFLLFAISTIILLLFFVLNTSTIKSQSTDIIYTASSIVDGDLIKTSNNPDIYIVKINNNLRYKRVILNPEIFNSYGHLEWSNVKTVSGATLNSFTTSQLVREVNENGKIVNGRVYMLFANGDTGIKRHIQLTAQEFLSAGGTDSSIYSINSTEASDTFYATGPSIATVQQLRGLLPTSLVVGDSSPVVSFPNPPRVPLPDHSLIIPSYPGPSDDDDDNNDDNNNNNNNNEDTTNRASLVFTKQTLQPATILPGSKQEVLTINVLVSNRSATVRSMKVALSPTTGTDTSIENTFNKIQLIVDGSVVSTKNIESTQDYEKVLNTAVITLNNLAIDIEEDSTKSIQIHLSTNTTIQESLLKDWNIIINKDSISAIDDDNNTYSNNNPITISTSVRRTNIPTTRPPSTVRNFTASSITTTSLTLSWDEYTNAEDYEVDYCEGSSCTNYSNSELTTGLTRQIDSLTQGTVYKFRIRAVLPNNRYSAYRTILQGTSLNTPTLSVSNSQATLTSISLLWTPVTNADGYVIEQCKRESKTTECTDYTISKTIPNQETTTTNIQSLTSSSLYQFRIKSKGNYPKIDSAFSDFSEAYTKFLPPTNLRVASTTSDTINILWNASPMSDGYTVQHCTSSTSCTEKGISDSTTTSEQVAGLTPNTAYTLSIRTESSIAGNSAYSTAITQRTTLSIPDNLRKTSSSLTSLTVKWNATTDADGYILQACEGAICTNFTSIYTGALLTYQHTGLTQGETYKFRVRATGASPKVSSNWSIPVNLVGELDPPTNLRATSQTNTTIDLLWDEVAGAAEYVIAYCDGGNCTPDETSPLTSTTKTLKVSSLSANRIYRFKIKATHTDTTLNSEYSEIFETRTTLSTPSNLRNTAQTRSSITLEWNRINNTSGYLIDYCKGASCIPDETTTITALSTETSKTITSLFANSIYKFRIKAQANNPSLPSAYSSSIEARTALVTPTTFRVTSQNATSINLGWDNVAGATGYTIEYCSGSASCTPTTTTTSLAATKSMTGLTENTIYRFRVKATGGTGVVDSAYTDILDTRTKLATPTGLSSTQSTATSVALSWTAVTDAQGYLIQYCSGSSCTSFTNSPPITSGTTTSKTITSLTANTIYRFRIKATGANPVVDSAYSGIVEQRTTLSVPTSLRATGQTDTSIDLEWSAVSGATGYSIQYCDGATCTDFADDTTSTTTTEKITGLSVNTVYRFKIKATGTNPAIDSAYSGVMDTRTTLSIPTNLASTATTINSVSLSWTAVTDAVGYTIQYCSSASCTNFAGDTASTATSEKITGLTANTTYRFRIKATGGTGVLDSAYSTPLNQATSEKLPIPSGVSASSVGASSIKVDWTATPDAQGYEIQYCNTASCIPTTSLTVAGGTTITQTLVSLTPNTIYRVHLRATHATATLNSDYSGIEEARTTLAVPTNLASTSTTINSISLSWTASTDATGYRIQYCDGVDCDEFDEEATSTNATGTIADLTAGTTYRFRVKATAALPVLDSTYSAALNKATSDKLPTPSGLSAVSLGSSSIKVDWTAVANAEGYEIQYCNGISCAPSTSLTVAGGTTITQTLVSLTANTIYRVRIRATHATSTLNSDYSSIAEARTTLSVPTNLASTATTINSVSLSWDAVTDATSYTIQYCNTASCTNFADDTTSTTTSEKITGLTPDTTYRFRIKATATTPVLESAYSPPLNKATADKLSIPASVSASSVDASSIKVDWTAVDDAQGYEIQYCNGATCAPTTSLTVAGGTTITQTLVSLTANTVYRVKIRATHTTTSLNSDYSGIEEARTTLSVPTNLASTASTINSVSLSWDAVTGATGYTIQYCSTASCTNFADDTTSTATSEKITGLTANTTYRFRIKATATAPVLDSAYSTPFNQATSNKLPTPTGVSASSVDASSIKVDWTAVDDAQGYEIQYCNGISCAPTTSRAVAGGTTITQTIASLTANTVYRVRIRATHATASLNSDYSGIEEARTTLSVPTNLASTATTINSISLSWTAVTDAVSYTIQYCDGVSCTDFAGDTTSTTTTETFAGLTANTTYRFRIKATATPPILESVYSSPLNKETTNKLPTPTSVSATSVDASSIKVDWTATPQANGYEIQYCNGATCTPTTSLTVADGTTITKTITGLTANTIYRVQIRATHATSSLNSDYSSIEEARTTLSIPTNLASTATSINSVSLSWTAVVGATSYTIQYCGGDSCTNFAGDTSSTATTETITGLTPNTIYRFRVKATATSPVLASEYSAPLNKATTDKLSTPAGVSVSSIDASSIKVDWTVTPDAEGYQIQYCNGTTCTPTTSLTVSGGTTTTQTIASLTANTIYRVQIRATHATASLNSDYSSAEDTRTTLSIPSDFRSTGSTINSITLAWSSVTDSSGYLIQYCDGVDCDEFDESSTITSNITTSKTLGSLNANTTYRFRIKATATSPALASPYSVILNKNTIEKLSTPSGVSATSVDASSIKVDWNAVDSANGYEIQYCNGTTCNPTTSLTVSGGTTITQTIASLTANTIYRVQVRATHATATLNSDYSSAVNTRTTLSIPDNLRKTSASLASLTIAWDTVTGADGYILQACEGATCTNFTSIYTGALLTYQHTSLTQGETYRFRIQATGATPKVNSGWSDISSYVASLDSPYNFRATGRTATSVTFEWDTISSATGYTVDYCRGTNCTPNETSTETALSTDTELTLSGLDGGITYRARIKASYAGSLESGYSDITNHNTRIGKPVNFQSTSHSVTEINLQWNLVHDSTVAGYIIEYCDGVSCTEFDETETISGGSTTKATVSSLSANTTYRFRIISTNPTLGSLFDSYPSDIVSQSTSATLSKPTNFATNSSTTTSITLDWDAVLSASGYLIQYCDGAGCSTLDEEETITNGATTSKTITGLTSSTVYRFRIKATHSTSSFDSIYSDILDTGTNLPTPTNLRSSNPTATRMSVDWDVVSNATGYILEYCEGASCTEFDNEEIVSGGSTSTTSVAGLTGSTIYNFRIKATGANSLESSYSSAVNFRTKLKRPSNFRSTFRSIASITLAWDEVPNADGYSIAYCDGAICTEFDQTETTSSGTTTTKTITGLTSNISYRFKITATSTHTGIDSYESSVLEESTTSTLPAPSGLMYAGRFGGGVTLRWSPVNDATGYTIQHCSGLSCTPSTAVDVSGGGTNSTVINLPSGAYGFRIKAIHTTSSFDSTYSQTVYAF